MVMLIFFIGGCAGSTSGGIKVIRHVIFFKNSYLEFKRILRPRAVVPLRLNGQIVRPQILTNILVFLLIYLILAATGTFALAMFGSDFETSFGAVVSCLGNVGLGMGDIGPTDHFGGFPPGVKWILTILMLLGRLELFTILVLFTPYFWKG